MVAAVEASVALQTLNLGNKCSGLSDVSPLSGLDALQTLDLSSCQGLSDVSPLSVLDALQTLNLGNTGLSDVSPLSGLVALQTLDLSSCQGLTDVSPLMDLHSERLPSIQDLRLFGCRLNDIPVAICGENDRENVLLKARAHFADLQQGQESDAELKLFVLGNGGVGKTQMCRRLRKLAFDKRIPTTHGVQLGECSTTVEGQSGTVRLRLWDFGGQDVYHGTHALFLQDQAIFVVLWTPQHEEEEGQQSVSVRNRPLAYWLDYIRALAGKANPVLVVQSQCDEPRQRRKQPQISGDFEYLRFIEFSARTDLGLDNLTSHIKEGVRNLLAARPLHQIGIGRAEVRRKLRKMLEEDQSREKEDRQHRTLTKDAFVKLCADTGNVSDPDALLDFLHRTGVLFYRPGLFDDRAILDRSGQRWTPSTPAAAFDREKSLPYLVRDGRFTRPHSWLTSSGENTVEEEQKTFLGMMRSCGICFPSREISTGSGTTEKEYIAPDLLPDWEGVQEHLFGRLQSSEPGAQATVSYAFLHEGILRTFLSRIGQQAGDAAVYWKYGCWFGEKMTKSVMLIQSHSQQSGWAGTITLAAWGGKANDLVERVLKTLLDIPLGQPPQVTRSSARDDMPKPDHFISPGGVETLHMSARAPLPGTAKKRVFLSYAWGDDKSPQGKERAEIAERLCVQVRDWGYDLVRDKDHMRWGELISDFIKMIGAGDRIIVILSEKYLRSVYCMTELHEIWSQSRSQAAEFVARIAHLTHADACIGGIKDRVKHARHWKEEVESLRQDVADGMLGESDYRDWKRMTRWVNEVSEMLKHLADVLHPVGFEQIVQDNFAALKALLEKDG